MSTCYFFKYYFFQFLKYLGYPAVWYFNTLFPIILYSILFISCMNDFKKNLN